MPILAQSNRTQCWECHSPQHIVVENMIIEIEWQWDILITHSTVDRAKATLEQR